uniref:Vomeronasal type-1 receptor n=1 Tax=Phocoena sinus TaxID=42100 RepID=A0A8C9C470_PHOSS
MLDFRTTFLLQTIFGILGNFCILYHYFLLYCTGYRLRTIDFIVRNVITANIFVLFSAGSHSEKFWVSFPVRPCGGQGSVHGHHLPLECLPGHQISPRTSRWAKLKVNALRCFVPPVILCRILNMSVNVIYPMYMSRIWRNQSITNRKSFRHCSAVCHEQTRDALFAALLSFPDVLRFVLMILASGSTVFILYRHKQRVQNIHRISVSSVSSLESRATKTVLLLVFCPFSNWVFFNILSCMRCLYLLEIKPLSVASFVNIFTHPFLLVSRDSSVHRLYFAWFRNTKSPTVRRNM